MKFLGASQASHISPVDIRHPDRYRAGGGQVPLLVVDDEPNIVDVIPMARRHHQFEAEWAATGMEALELTRKGRIHGLEQHGVTPAPPGSGG